MPTSIFLSNVRLLRWHNIMLELSFMTPTVMLFALTRGVSTAEYLAIQGIFALTIIVTSPLVGPWIDRLGRQPSILVGSVLWALGHGLLLVGHGWQVYALAEFILGVGVAIFAPAAEALLYDSHAALEKQDAHYAAQTRQGSASSVGAAVAGVTGGLLFSWVHPAMPVALTFAGNLVMVGLAWRLKELRPGQSLHKVESPSIGSMLVAAVQVLSSRSTRWMVILPALLSSGTLLLFWSAQPTLGRGGLGPVAISALFGGYFLARSCFYKKSPAIVARLSLHKCFGLAIALVAAAFAGMALLPWYMAFPLFVIGSGLTHPMVESIGNELVNRHASSSFRATALAVRRMLNRIATAVTMFLAGLLAGGYTEATMLLVMGGAITIIALASLTRLPGEAILHPARKAA